MLQQTTSGLAFYRKATNIPTFTNGWEHWGWTADGLVYWTGDAVDPPGYEPVETPTPTPDAVPTPVPTPVPTVAAFVPPDVEAMDERSGGPGVEISTAVATFVEEVAATWGWLPTALVTFYLHGNATGFSAGLERVLGREVDRAFIEQNIAGVAVSIDVTTGGRAVVMNLASTTGSLRDLEVTKVILAHEYTHVLQFDFAGELRPTWFVEGMADTVSYASYPLGVGFYRVNETVPQALRDGTLPSLRELNDNWGSFQSSLERLSLAYGTSYYAVNHAAQKVGGMPLLMVLADIDAGATFEEALLSRTGFTLDSLDASFRAALRESGLAKAA